MVDRSVHTFSAESRFWFVKREAWHNHNSASVLNFSALCKLHVSDISLSAKFMWEELMNDSWIKNAVSDFSLADVWKDIESFGNQVKRNVDMRMRRGDVRSAILRLLQEAPMHGYQIIHEIQSRSHGAWKPSPGSIYPTLQLLADEGLIVSQEADGRRTYSLTDAGREVAESEAVNPAPWLTGSERPAGPRGTLAQAGLKIAKAAAEVARTGTPEQMEKAARVLDDATKALSAIVKHN